MNDKKNKILIKKVSIGFSGLAVNEKYKKDALKFLEQWLKGQEFKNYWPQILNLINKEEWSYLLDSFYQVIPFGTGGRRGEVGVGPNRINLWTIQASAQGHSQYLLKKYGAQAKSRGVVFAYDVREFFGNKYLDNNLLNPVKNLTSFDLAQAAAEVYSANGIKVYIFKGVRTTPELSFAIRELKAVAGAMFSASHNPPSHNGKKVYDEFGGQLIPPDDEILVKEVISSVKKIKTISYQAASQKGLIKKIGVEIDRKYLKAAANISLSKERNLKIAYTALHGCGITSVPRALELLGFKVDIDKKTSNFSGRFENITFNIPNPEVRESFDTALEYAKKIKADILLSSDPDADRVGVMVSHHNDWIFLNGNEIAAILSAYVISKKKITQKNSGVIIKTIVTTNLIKKICLSNKVDLIGELLVGFKYVAEEMNLLDKKGKIKDFYFGCEESHGYLSGNYSRDKDAVTAAVWLAELAAELKKKKKTLVDYLLNLYSQYGYFRNYLTEIRLLGATGNEKINQIQATIRNKPPKIVGRFKINSFEDCWNRKPLVSETDKASKNVFIFKVSPPPGIDSIKVIIRPSGTEPKIKVYFEVGAKPVKLKELFAAKNKMDKLIKDLETDFLNACYKSIGVDFPSRGFLLFWQLPLEDKLKYFVIEKQIIELKKESNVKLRQEKLGSLLAFLGSDPIKKVDLAFMAKHKKPLLKYLGLR